MRGQGCRAIGWKWRFAPAKEEKQVWGMLLTRGLGEELA